MLLNPCFNSVLQKIIRINLYYAWANIPSAGWRHTKGSDSKELGVESLPLRSSGGETVLWGPMLGGGRWYSFDWSCWADGHGNVSRTHSTGSSQAAFCPCTCNRDGQGRILALARVWVGFLWLNSNTNQTSFKETVLLQDAFSCESFKAKQKVVKQIICSGKWVHPTANTLNKLMGMWWGGILYLDPILCSFLKVRDNGIVP